jgi:hypothetical protein
MIVPFNSVHEINRFLYFENLITSVRGAVNPGRKEEAKRETSLITGWGSHFGIIF